MTKKSVTLPLEYDAAMMLRDMLMHAQKAALDVGRSEHHTTAQRTEFLRKLEIMGESIYQLNVAFWDEVKADPYFGQEMREEMERIGPNLGVLYGPHQDPDLSEFEAQLSEVCDKDHNDPNDPANKIVQELIAMGAEPMGSPFPGMQVFGMRAGD